MTYLIRSLHRIFTFVNELKLIEILWDTEIPLSSNDISDVAPKDSWKSGSIFHILNRLVEKDAIMVVGMQVSGKVFGRTYVAKLTREMYKIYMQSVVHSDKMKFVGQFSALLKDNQLTHEIFDELEDILADIRKDLPKS